jgi:hypothetical protein
MTRITQMTRNNSDEKKIIYPELSYKVVGILYEVDNILGYGHSEKNICKAIEAKLEDAGFNFVSQSPYSYKTNRKEADLVFC